jgi:hypothetical protein
MSLGHTLLKPHLIVNILDIPRYPLPHSFVETGGRVLYVPLLQVGSSSPPALSSLQLSTACPELAERVNC